MEPGEVVQVMRKRAVTNSRKGRAESSKSAVIRRVATLLRFRHPAKQKAAPSGTASKRRLAEMLESGIVAGRGRHRRQRLWHHWRGKNRKLDAGWHNPKSLRCQLSYSMVRPVSTRAANWRSRAAVGTAPIASSNHTAALIRLRSALSLSRSGGALGCLGRFAIRYAVRRVCTPVTSSTWSRRRALRPSFDRSRSRMASR